MPHSLAFDSTVAVTKLGVRSTAESMFRSLALSAMYVILLPISTSVQCHDLLKGVSWLVGSWVHASNCSINSPFVGFTIPDFDHRT